MEYDPRLFVKQKSSKEVTSHGLTTNVSARSVGVANGDGYHITVPPSMKEEFSAQRSRQQDQRITEQLQELTFASPMEHLQEENRRLKSELEELGKNDGSGMAAKVLEYGNDIRAAKGKLREAERRVRQLESERNRTRPAVGNVGMPDPEYERLRDAVQQWKSEAERWKSEVTQLRASLERPQGQHSGNAPVIAQGHGPEFPPRMPQRSLEPRVYQDQVKQLERQLDEVMRINNELRHANTDWDIQYKRMKADYDGQVDQLQESLKDIQTQLMKAIENAGEEKTQQTDRARRLEEKLTVVQQRAEQAERRIQTFDAEYHELKRDYDAISGRWNQVSAQYSEVQQRNDALRREIAQLQERGGWQQGVLPDEVEALKQQNKHIRDRYERERGHRQALEKQLEQVRGDRRMPEANRGGYQYQDDETAALRQQVELFKDDYEREKQEKQRLDREVSRLQQIHRSQEANRTGFRVQGDEIEALRAQSQVFKDDYEHEREEKQRLERQMSEKQRALRSLELTNVALQQQVDQCQQDFQRERQDKEDYLRQLRRERSGGSGQHQLVGSPRAMSTVQRFGDEMIQEQHDAWGRYEQQRAGQQRIPDPGIPQEVNPQPNIIGGAPV